MSPTTTTFTGRIAMWSGPRNISTAMMRSFGNRPGGMVVDEPFYGHYLQKTGLDHPGAEEIIGDMATSESEIIRDLIAPLQDGIQVYYQKHMTHHMLPGMSLDWLGEVNNCFLIRDPQEVMTSYQRVREIQSIDDIGFARQAELFRFVRENFDPNPPVLDARDVLTNPRGVLSKLCERLGIQFDEGMLTWPAGPHPSDGIWSKYWYAAVEKSTGFAPYKPKYDEVPDHLRPMLAEAQALYDEMAQFRIQA